MIPSNALPQKELGQLKVLIILLVGGFFTLTIWSCRTDAPVLSSSNEEEEVEEEEEPSPDVDEVDLDDVEEPPLNRAETILRDRVATQVCINNTAIKSALADMTCRIKEQLSWLTYSQLYKRTSGKDECYTRAKSLEKKFLLNEAGTQRTDTSSDGSAWLETSCKKLTGQGFVDLDYLKRRKSGNPVTESELRSKLEEILGDKNYEDLKQGGSTTHLEGLLKFNTYGLNEKCSAELRYDPVRAISKSNFKVKPLLMTAHALSEPVSNYMERFRGTDAPTDAKLTDLPFSGGDIITVAGKNGTDIIGVTYRANKPQADADVTISHANTSGTTVTKTVTITAIINHKPMLGGPDLPSARESIGGIRKITVKATDSDDHFCLALTDGVTYGPKLIHGILNNGGVVMDKIVPSSPPLWNITAVTIKPVERGTIKVVEEKPHEHCLDDAKWGLAGKPTKTAMKNALIANTKIHERVGSLTEKEKDFYLMNWPKLRNSFAGLPDGVKGEFDYLHFYKRSSQGTRSSTVQDNVLQTIRVLKATCGKSASNQRAYLRADTQYMNSTAESPQANFFSRTQFHIKVSPFTSRCQMTKVNRNFEGSESRYTPAGSESQSLDPDFMCASNGVGYLCYERDLQTHASGVIAKTACNKPPMYDGNKYFLRRGRHCMCAEPSSTSTIDQYKSGNSNSITVNDTTNLNALCSGSAELYKDIKLEGDAGDLKNFGADSKTLMEYLVDNHTGDIVRRSAQNDGECIAGLDYIDLCEDDNFKNHPDIRGLKRAYCPTN